LFILEERFASPGRPPSQRPHPDHRQYFNGDNGSGVGANHQTGWTALIACLLFEYSGRQGRA
jgi:hypothetical protein